MSHLAHTQRKKKEHRNCKQHLTTTTCPRFPLPLPFLSAPSHSNVKDTEALHSQKSLGDCFSRICLCPGNEKVVSVVVGVATSAAGDFFAATQPIIFFLATTGETHTTSLFLSSPPPSRYPNLRRAPALSKQLRVFVFLFSVSFLCEKKKRTGSTGRCQRMPSEYCAANSITHDTKAAYSTKSPAVGASDGSSNDGELC